MSHYNLSAIMTRAWELARLNRRTIHEKHHPDFAKFLRFAWKEAKTPPKPPVSAAQRLRGEIMALEGASLNMRVGARLNDLRAQLRAAA